MRADYAIMSGSWGGGVRQLIEDLRGLQILVRRMIVIVNKD